ncbi:MAG TPA: immunoglobulin domain-containing protein [Blastocatellia bacterium]
MRKNLPRTALLTIAIALATVGGNLRARSFTSPFVSPNGDTAMYQAGPECPVVTLNPVSQAVALGDSVTFTAAASGVPTPTVQWQVSRDGGRSFISLAHGTSTTLTFTATPTVGGRFFRYRAIFSNTCGMAITTGAMLTLLQFDECLKDDTTGNHLEWNSVTGQYAFSQCSGALSLSGAGTVSLVDGIHILTASTSTLRLSAGINSGQRTGTATIYFMVVPGVWQTFRINDTNPPAVCSCSG